MSGLEELYGNDAETNEPVAETPAAESVAAPAPQAEPVVQVEAPLVETPAPVAEPQEHSVPLNVLLRTREEFGGKLSAAERELAVFRAEKAERERKAREAAAQAPDILEDPQGYMEWSERRQREIVRREVAAVKAEQTKAVETISRNMMLRHIGPEKFAELDKFIQAAPDQAHALAFREGAADPYGWFYEKFEKAQQHRKAQEAAKQLESFGGKSIEEVIAERVAAALAGQGQQPAAPIAVPATPRNPDGTFAPQPTQRHTPQSLAEVNGSAVIASNGSSGSALEELYNN